MSQDQPLSRKDKKAQRDAERKKSGKKRKHVELDGEENAEQSRTELQDDFIPLNVDNEDAQKAKSVSKKRKAVDVQVDGEETGVDKTEDAPKSSEPKPKKRKKQKPATTNGETGEADAPAATKSKVRFVCFIGNLPYTTTDEALQAHFKKLQPFTVRHRVDPQTKKSKGFAFLEFENYDRMKTCLKLYHHSMFDPTAVKAADVAADVGEEGQKKDEKKVKSKKGARRINVELTAGGGGKNEERKQKIKAKNVRLNEQRQRRAQAEAEQREKEKAEKGAGGGEVGSKKGAKESAVKDESAGIHPSRLARMKT